MEDRERIATYIDGIYMLTFLSEWKQGERLGIKAKIYNTITKKHNVFHKQLLEEKTKKKSCSKNCRLFVIASSIAIKSWDRATNETKGLTISVSTTIRNIYNLNKENFTRLYGLKEEDFVKFDKEEGVGVKTFSSCKMGRVLSEFAKEETEKYLEEKKGTKI